MKDFKDVTDKLVKQMLESIEKRIEIQKLCGYTDQEMVEAVARANSLIKSFYL